MPLSTETVTKTSTVTNTKLLVATLALAAAGGLAFMLAPSSTRLSPKKTTTSYDTYTTSVTTTPTATTTPSGTSTTTTKLLISWSNDTPSGAASPGAAQLVAKIVAANPVNPGNYTATLKNLELQILSTITAKGPRQITVYKDSLATTPLGSYTFASGTIMNATTNFTDAGFADVAITPGSSKTFFYVLDTQDARATNTISIGSAFNGVTWSDGVTANIFAPAQDVSLPWKTLSY